MSGILDNKSRVLDTFVTDQGRSQIAQGKMRIAYAHFTDAAVVYARDAVSGTDDATTKIYFESSNLPQDQITFEADDSGRLKPFPGDFDVQLYAGQLLSSSFSPTTSSIITGSNENLGTLTDVAFASQISGILTSSLNNIKKLRVLTTNDPFSDEGTFAFGPTNVGFVLGPEQPVKRRDYGADVNWLESIFADPRLGHLENFSYLPPVNKIDDKTINTTNVSNLSPFLLGDYRPVGPIQTLSGDDILDELKVYEKNGFMKTIFFEPTSKNNNMAAQFFEVTSDTVKKLDVIDYGRVNTREGLKHVFFVGKVMLDNYNVHKFIHLFTLVFE